MKRTICRVALVATAIVVAACGTGSGEGLDANGRPVGEAGEIGELTASLKSIQDNVFTPTCAVSGCHVGAAAPQGLKLDADSAFAFLVGVPSGQEPTLLRVAPGDPDNSYLVQKLEGTAAGGVRMPANGPPYLDQTTIALIRQWIADGALPDLDGPDLPPTVVSVSPADGALLDDLPAQIEVLFSADMDASLLSADTVIVQRAGGDSGFSDGNEVMLQPASVALDSANARRLLIDLSGSDAIVDLYSLTLSGSGATALAGADGTVLDGDADDQPGGDFVAGFEVAPVLPTLESIQAKVFTPTCAVSGCHSGPAGPGLPEGQDLSSAEASFASLVGVQSLESPQQMRVAAGNADDSYLIAKLEGTALPQMPLGGTPLSAETIATIRSWIDDGAILEGATPADNSPPVVTLTAIGPTLSGVVALGATAVDNVAVVDVQFFVDGNSIGTSATAPFAVAWDTATVSDGAYQVTATARDAAGNSATSTVLSVSVQNQPADLSAPTITLAAPPPTVAGSVTFSASASDDNGVTEVTFLVDGAAIGSDSSNDFEVLWDSTAVSNGAHALRAEARDAAGNVGNSATFSFTVANDAEPPTVSITTPAAGMPLSGDVVLTAQADDDIGVSEVEFFVDGTSLGVVLNAPYSITWDTNTVAEGAHVLSASATDSVGNSTDSAPVDVTVRNDTTPPAVSIVAPAGTDPLSGPVPVQVSATDANAIILVRVFVDGTEIGSDAAGPPFEVFWDTSSASDGAHTISASAEDESGNIGTSATLNVTVDNECGTDLSAPTIALTQPVAGFAAGMLTLAADAVDDVSVTQVFFFVDGNAVGSDASAPYSVTWDSTGVADGPVQISAQASDGCNQTTSSPVALTIDNTGPAVSVTAPVAGFVSGTVSLQADATDAGAGVALVRFLVDAIEVASDSGAPFDAPWVSSGVADGAYLLTARAEDSLGNTSDSAAIAITVDNAAPRVILVDPADGAGLSSAPAAITIVFDEDLEPASVSAMTVSLHASGGDGTFNDGNEQAIVADAVTLTSTDTITMDLSSATLADDDYQLIAFGDGAGPLSDLAGNALDGDGDGNAGTDFRAGFSIAMPVTYTADVQPIFFAKCAPCHTGFGFGGHDIGTDYLDAFLPANDGDCDGLLVGECTIVRIQSGEMPQNFGCTGDPVQDAGMAQCLTQQEQDLVQAWIDAGMPE